MQPAAAAVFALYSQLLRSAPRDYAARRVRADYLERVRHRLQSTSSLETGAAALS